MCVFIEDFNLQLERMKKYLTAPTTKFSSVLNEVHLNCFNHYTTLYIYKTRFASIYAEKSFSLKLFNI